MPPEPRGPIVEVDVPCAVCGGSAARIAVLHEASTDATDGTGGSLIRGPRYVVDAPGFGVAHAVLAGAGPDLATIAIALADRDLARLFRLDPEYAPMWCPECAAAYCSREWALWQVFDPDQPDWFEELRGRCPAGHERMVYD